VIHRLQLYCIFWYFTTSLKISFVGKRVLQTPLQVEGSPTNEGSTFQV